MIILRIEDKYESSGPKFDEFKEDDFQLWSIRLKAALRSRELMDLLTNTYVGTNKSERALRIVIGGLGDNRMRAIQDGESAYDS